MMKSTGATIKKRDVELYHAALPRTNTEDGWAQGWEKQRPGRWSCSSAGLSLRVHHISSPAQALANPAARVSDGAAAQARA